MSAIFLKKGKLLQQDSIQVVEQLYFEDDTINILKDEYMTLSITPKSV